MHNADTSTRSHTCHWAGPRLYELILWLGLGVINYWWAVTVDQNEKDLNLLSPTAGKHVTWNMSICTYVCGASSSVSGTGWLWTAHTRTHAHTHSHTSTRRDRHLLPSSQRETATFSNQAVQRPVNTLDCLLDKYWTVSSLVLPAAPEIATWAPRSENGLDKISLKCSLLFQRQAGTKKENERRTSWNSRCLNPQDLWNNVTWNNLHKKRVSHLIC